LAKINNVARGIIYGTEKGLIFTNATNVEGTDNLGKYLVPIETGDELIAKN